MMNEVEDVNRTKGWYDEKNLTSGELLALLHSEVSETLEAFRRWGLADATKPVRSEYGKHGEVIRDIPSKPEGVGSEFADILIRLLDMSRRLNVDLDSAYKQHSSGRFGVNGNFGCAVNVMHMHISRLAFEFENYPRFDDELSISYYYVRILKYLIQWSEFLDIDLEAEYKRKMAYNRTREYRHGGKLL